MPKKTNEKIVGGILLCLMIGLIVLWNIYTSNISVYEARSTSVFGIIDDLGGFIKWLLSFI